jgi:UDP-2,4-diacetamido-2,4,6-trideoxy-beta-L-altropyranose hydrolase
MRCLALAQAWQDSGGDVIFVTGRLEVPLERRLKSGDLKVIHLEDQPGGTDDAIETASLARGESAAWVVLDGYHFDVGYQRVIKDAGLRLLLIDDNGHGSHYHADVVLNQNIHADEELYARRAADTRLLLGNRYALLRREFFRWQGWTRDIPEVARKVLVTLGGGDSDNVTLKVIRALQQVEVEGIEVVVVVGPANPHEASLRERLVGSPFAVQLLSSVRDMPQLMTWADVAISGGGSTCVELAFMGLPSLVLTLAHNQVLGVERLHTEGVALSLGWHHEVSCEKMSCAIRELLVTSEMRQEMARRGPELVDGKGTERVLMSMDDRAINLRQVCEKDWRLLWEWANEKDVRSVSFTSGIIPREKHVQWLKSKLNNPNCIFYIVSNGKGEPIGQVRYDLDGEEAVISISIDLRFRGQGYGRLAILLSSQKIFDTSDARIIHAYAKQSNELSVRAFLKAGFKNTGTRMIRGHQAIDFVLTKDPMV